MSQLTMTTAEAQQIDAQVGNMFNWAKNNTHEAEQLAMDASRLFSCTNNRINKLSSQGFFRRCWSRFSGEAASVDRANVADLAQMQKISLRYINMLQEEKLMMAHTMIAIKNNLLSLNIIEEETHSFIVNLANRTKERFEQLESRVGQLEISSNLQGWLLALEERDYDEKIPTEHMRLFRVINDFYSIKNDNWNYNDLMFMRKAIRTVGIDPKKRISLNVFIDSLVDEIQNETVGFENYGKAITAFNSSGINYSQFALENISSPVFIAMHDIRHQFLDRLDIVETLQDEMNISISEALKRLIRRGIGNLNVNLDYEFPLAETAIEILGCLRLMERLSNPPFIEQSVRHKHTDKAPLSVESPCFDLQSFISKAKEAELPPIAFAAFKRNTEALQALLNSGVDIDEKDEEGVSALMFFAQTDTIIEADKIPIMELLLKHGANINFKHAEHITPLAASIGNGEMNLAHFLLDHGVDVNTELLCGDNIFTYLCFTIISDKDYLKIMKKAELEKRLKTRQKIGFAKKLAFEKKLALIKMLLNNGANINATVQIKGKTFTHLCVAVGTGNTNLIELLLERGIDIDENAIANAVASKDMGIATALLDRGINIDNKIQIEDILLLDNNKNIQLEKKLFTCLCLTSKETYFHFLPTFSIGDINVKEILHNIKKSNMNICYFLEASNPINISEKNIKIKLQFILYKHLLEAAEKYHPWLYLYGVSIINSEIPARFIKLFPSQKIHSGLRSFGNNMSIDDVLVYYDSTLFGGGDDGFILTEYAIYFKQRFEDKKVIKYKDIKNVASDKYYINITTYKDEKYRLSCTEEICIQVVSTLQEIIKFFS